MSYESPGAIPAATSDERTMAMLAHLGGIVLGFIPALVIYLTKGNESGFVKEQSREALNFQITVMFAWIASFVLMIVVIGFLLVPVVWIGSIVLAVMAGITSNKGEDYRYPINIRLVK